MPNQTGESPEESGGRPVAGEGELMRPTGLSYGKRFRLVHRETGRFLAVLPESVSASTASHHYRVVATIAPSRNTIWSVQGSSFAVLGNVSESGDVFEGDRVQLVNDSTQRYLFSSNEPAPIPVTGQFQVTAYDESDANDDWQVLVPGATSDAPRAVKLLHIMTSTPTVPSFLHSHDHVKHKLPRLPNDDQSVTCCTSDNAEDFWLVQPLDPSEHSETVPGSSGATLANYEKTFSAYTPDLAPFNRPTANAQLDDSLQVGVYAGHLAQLIAAKETRMPLSIGLFGAWGAGKSYFIELLDERLRGLAEGNSNVFHKHIVQMRFNAWHYLDTNLWANLVCEIFDQLFAAISAGGADAADKIKNLQKKLTEQSSLAVEADESLKIAKAAREAAEQKLHMLTEKRIAAQGAVGDLLSDVGNLLVADEQLKTKLEQASDEIGLPKLQNSFEELSHQAQELRSLAGRSRALVMAILFGPGSPKRVCLFSAAVIVPLLIWLLSQVNVAFAENWLLKICAVIVQISAFMGFLSAWLSKGLQAGKAGIAKFESAYDQLQKLRKNREASPEVLKAKTELAVKQEAEKEARHILREAETKIVEISLELAELAPGRQLIRFLKERASAEEYRRHLGLVSLIRKDFERLSNLLIEAAKVGDSSLPQIDRIVLYIDDLDRCRADRVVEVLEAVHLLLAFPLFAVVVAVDPRWLRQSLLDQYPRLLAASQDAPTNPQQRAAAGPATSQDYLEKIFQIPFNLQPIQKAGYDTLIQQLFSTARPVAVAAVAQPQIPALIAGPSDEGWSNLAPLPLGSGKSLRQSVDSPNATNPATATKSSPNPKKLVLTAKEISDMERFQPLFQTPRAVKRFANTYSLVRVAVEEAEWLEYLGPDHAPGNYRMPMVLLAVAATFPSIASFWLRWLKEESPTKWHFSDEDFSRVKQRYAGTDTAEWERLAFALSSLDFGGWPTPTRKLIDTWVPRVARYSF